MSVARSEDRGAACALSAKPTAEMHREGLIRGSAPPSPAGAEGDGPRLHRPRRTRRCSPRGTSRSALERGGGAVSPAGSSPTPSNSLASPRPKRSGVPRLGDRGNATLRARSARRGPSPGAAESGRAVCAGRRGHLLTPSPGVRRSDGRPGSPRHPRSTPLLSLTWTTIRRTAVDGAALPGASRPPSRFLLTVILVARTPAAFQTTFPLEVPLFAALASIGGLITFSSDRTKGVFGVLRSRIRRPAADAVLQRAVGDRRPGLGGPRSGPRRGARPRVRARGPDPLVDAGGAPPLHRSPCAHAGSLFTATVRDSLVVGLHAPVPG